MSNVIELTQANFNETTGTGTTVIDVWAPWCGPCKQIAGDVEEAADELAKSGIKVAKVDAEIQIDLVKQLAVRAVPTFILFKDGKAVSTRVGAIKKADILNFAKA